jgi:RNA polymerase sigma-70 factor (ECF subfamily)
MSKIDKKEIDEQCVERFMNGDMRAFDEIYSFFSVKLYKFVDSIIKSEQDAQDLVQEVFVKVWENRHRLKKKSSFNSYLFTVAYNSTISFLRKKVKEPQYVDFINSIQEEEVELNFSDDSNENEVREKINLLIEQMPKKQREVFKLKYFQQMSYVEIAKNMGISVNTVENHIVRAHKFLKANLKNGSTSLSLLLFFNLFF